MSISTVIESRDLSVAFPSDSGQVNLAITGVDVSVGRGESICLIGPSGCGKSTFLNVTAGLLRPSFGEILYNGQPLQAVNDRVGYVTQQHNLLPWRTVAKNVELGLEIAGPSRKERRARVRDAIELVGLSDAAKRYPGQLSGGMKSRASLARTLVMEPETLLMDEPFAALDAQRRVALQEELLKVKQRTGVTIVFVTHDLDEAITIADRIVVFAPGPASHVKNVYDVPFDQPRDVRELRTDPRYAELWSTLWQDLSH